MASRSTFSRTSKKGSLILCDSAIEFRCESHCAPVSGKHPRCARVFFIAAVWQVLQ